MNRCKTQLPRAWAVFAGTNPELKTKNRTEVRYQTIYKREEYLMLSDARRIIVGLLICLLASGPMAMAEELPHKLGLFGGITQDRNNTSETGASVGLTYEYRLNKFWGVGGMLEYAGGDIDAWVVGVPVFAHPFAGWFVVTAPGLEFESEETSVILRIGTGYDFELGERFSLAPEFYMDLNRKAGTKWVYGLSLVWAF